MPWLAQARTNVNSSAAIFLRLRSGAMTARSSGRSMLASPTSAECQSPHSQASRLTPANPSQDAVSSAWKESLRISPSLMTRRPTSSWSATAARTARSSTALNSAVPKVPRATSFLASSR